MPTGNAAIDGLLRRAFSEKGTWPLAREVKIAAALRLFSAFADGDKPVIFAASAYSGKLDRYRLDNLGSAIVEAWGAYLYGDDPKFTPGAEADIDNLARVLGRDYPSDLEGAGRQASAEGEVWGRVVSDPVNFTRPLLRFHSRRDVFPHYVHGEIRAAAYVRTLRKANSNTKDVHRLFEIHAEGIVVNKLFRGEAGKLGREVALSEHPDLAPDEDGIDRVTAEWLFARPVMLLQRIPNRLGSDKTLGISDIGRVVDQLLDLNDTLVTGASNMRLTAKKRAVVDPSIVDPAARDDFDLTPDEYPDGGPRAPQAKFDADEEVFVADPLDTEVGGTARDPFRVIEYSFDAGPLIVWRKELVATAINRCGLVGQYVGAETEGGYAISGTALRLRFIPTERTGRAKERHATGPLQNLILGMQIVDSLPVEQMGFGTPWADALTPPAVKLGAGLPIDAVEEAGRHAQLVGAGLESREQAVASLNPDWSTDQVSDELDKISDDESRRADAPVPPGLDAPGASFN